MQNPICIGQIIRHAKVFNFKQQGGGSMHPDSLLQAVERLFTLLHERQIAYLLVGVIAML